MTVFEKNLDVLLRRFPQAAQRVSAARRGDGFEGAMRKGGKSAVLASRWLQGRRVREGALLAISGFGDASHVRALLGVLPAGSRLFIGEADAVSLRAVFDREDVADLIDDPRLLLGVGPLDDGFFEPLTAAHAVAMLDVEPWIYAPCYNRDPAYYARFFLEFARFVDFRRKLEGTRIVDAALWQENSFLNLAELADAPELDALAGLFRGRAAVLVSAGPSLDESLDFLRAAQKVAVIIAVNSSYRAVRNAGIVPHLVLAADPREFTARGFAGVPTDGTWLVTTPIVHPDVVRMFSGRSFVWSGANQLFVELRRRLGLPPGIQIVEQGTVSACGVDLAIIMGCDRICLVGQDLAVRDNGQSHASDSFYTDMQANRIDTSGCRRLPGNTRPEVLVEEKLFVYLKTFEQLALHRQQARFCNTARLGARIEGMPYMPLDRALAWLGDRSTFGAMEALGKRHREGSTRALGAGRVRAALEPTRAFAEQALRLALVAASRIEALPQSVLSGGEDQGGEVATALEAVHALRTATHRDAGNFTLLEGGRTRLELFKATTFELQQTTSLPPAGRRLLAEREYAWAIAEGAWFLLNQLERYLGPPANTHRGVKTL